MKDEQNCILFTCCSKERREEMEVAKKEKNWLKREDAKERE